LTQSNINNDQPVVLEIGIAFISQRRGVFSQTILRTGD